MKAKVNQHSLYTEDPRIHQRDACGVGFVAHMHGDKSHQMVKDGLTILHRLDHRGGRASDGRSGDGAGIMLQIPDDFFRRELKKQSVELPNVGQYAVGMIFLPKNQTQRQELEKQIDLIAQKNDLKVIAWRNVSVDSSVLGDIARRSEPCIRQIFLAPNKEGAGNFHKKLFIGRKMIEAMATEKLGNGQTACYVASLSAETIVYKGLLLSHHIDAYYQELTNDDVVSAFAMVHQRFSTNTLPAWPLAQPFRYIGHNGEINTLRGNLNWMTARSSLLREDTSDFLWFSCLPICSSAGSDSANLDNAVEFLLQTGRPIAQVLSMLIPEPWEGNASMSPELQAYYEYQSYLMEPWDGPAFVGFANGDVIGAVLDRNGLRPGRYIKTHDDRVIMASESGVLDISEEMIQEKGRLMPGRMFIVDIKQGRIIPDEEIKRDLANYRNYGEWLHTNRIKISDLKPANQRFKQVEAKDLHYFHKRFSYSREDLKFILKPMSETGKEPIGSMGNDTPIAALSAKRPLLYNYFKQLFAQVTNPPIDAIREQLVTSLSVRLGAQGNILNETKEQCSAIYLEQPLLTDEQFAKLLDASQHSHKIDEIDITYDPSNSSLEEIIYSICQRAGKSVSAGFEILVLTDRALNSERLAVPALLVVGAVHHHLIKAGLRTKCSLVLASGEPREVHHFCTLIGYGAEAIFPYLALETARFISGEAASTAVENYLRASHAGILKVMSKMGIATLQSYCGAQIFEALGLSSEVIERFFSGTVSRIQGIDLSDIEDDLLHRFKVDTAKADLHLNELGNYHWRRDGESHLHSPHVITKLQQATRIKGRDQFNEFCSAIDQQNETQLTLRGLFEMNKIENPIDLSEVEPASAIMRRFSTGAMSFGSISKEAHETIAIAMNRVGARSNSGEGGEDPRRFIADSNGDLRRSAIKQVASGRFGVTSHYLVNADEIQIKMAQGAKPGEGGQLPGHKVDEEIARVRHSTPGVPLISPPPHHDIYSIEDLAQLIFDLKCANENADVSVKLVSAVGVGTIASGVAKAKADAILISGYEGGTGASPLTSIKHAGLPWELGLADTHRMLTKNALRERVRLVADGQLRTPRDLAIATMLGADEWSIGTGALITIGCIMMRKCHLNSCPVGIATQDPILRKKFAGKPEHLINYLYLLAEGLREVMAGLGIQTVDELIGRSDLLRQRKIQANPRANKLDLSYILGSEKLTNNVLKGHTAKQDHKLEDTFDYRHLLDPCKLSLSEKKNVSASFPIINTDRAVGTILSSRISRLFGSQGLPEGTIRLNFEGSAGQSFMAFGARGICATVFGDVNDYCAKGLSGAEVVVRPHPKASRVAEQNVICGNTTLYGATSGRLFIRGVAGERFAVRNSGAVAVVEGVGDHGCEYMTGGRVLILGPTGRNFAAGMSGGIAYVLDSDGSLSQRVNHELVECSSLSTPEDLAYIWNLLNEYHDATQSPVAMGIISNWKAYQRQIVRVIPIAYREIMETNTKSSRMNNGIETHKPLENGQQAGSRNVSLDSEDILEVEQGGFHG